MNEEMEDRLETRVTVETKNVRTGKVTLRNELSLFDQSERSASAFQGFMAKAASDAAFADAKKYESLQPAREDNDIGST